MTDASFSPAIERRRSQRVSEAVPLVVRGIDLLGNPFEERTATQSLNLQGCRYFSTHHLPRNSWISLEVGDGPKRHNVRARVAWIRRPHSIRELFHIAIELEGAGNIWGLASQPEGWTGALPQDADNGHQSPTADTTAFSAPHTPTEGSAILMSSYPVESGDNFDVPFGAAMPRAGMEIQDDITVWRERLASEMTIAQRQWEELLQSSIDRTLQRLAEQLPERAQETVRSTEEKLAHQGAELTQLLAKITAEGHGAAANVKASVDQEIWRVRDAVENTRQQLLDRIGAEAEARVAPHAARIPELLRELAAREELIGESLRLHRERLRQASESTLRELAGQAEGLATTLRSDFETARAQVLSALNQEMESMGTRAGQTAGEAISRTSEWVQQETRERLQVLAEQTLANATSSFQQETSKATAQFATHLEGQALFHMAQVHQQLDGVANDLTTRTRTQLAEAAEAAAASLGQVLGNLSNEHTQQFASTTQNTIDQKRWELDQHVQNVHSAFESDSTAKLQDFRQQTSWHFETAIGEARSTLANESAVLLETHRNEHNLRAQQFSDNLNRVAADAEAQSTSRIQTAADNWTLASVRRLNEHGQNVMESLIRSADQALRDSASRMFENLAAGLRQQRTEFAQAAAASVAPSEQEAQNYAPVNDNFTPTSHQPDAQN